MKAICLIPARGDSKRIPHKNIQNLAGKPLIAYTIEKALDSNIFIVGICDYFFLIFFIHFSNSVIIL